MDVTTLRSRITGSLDALLIGDALGCPVEMKTPAEIRARYGTLHTLEDTPRPWWRPAGLHSDDSQQTVALCDALLESPDAPEVPFARTLVEIYRAFEKGPGQHGGHRGTGKNFRLTVDKLVAVEAADPFAGAQDTAGNGVAMLAAPIAWRWPADAVARREALLRVARVKTTDPRAAGAAAALVEAVVHGLTHGTLRGIDPARWIDATADVERLAAERWGSDGATTHAFSRALTAMLARLPCPRAEMLSAIAGVAGATSDRPVGPSAGYALGSVVTALYLALDAPTLERALIDAVNLGDDADTVGAMVGAVRGAADGAGAVPKRWREGLWAKGAFNDRVEALVAGEEARWPGGGGGWRPKEPLATSEGRWSRMAERARLAGEA
jgi:ADP-ribosyl-[dinitrogen reductase] hydrolase